MSAAVRMRLAAKVDADAGFDAGLDADLGDTSLGVRPRFSFIATGYGSGASSAWKESTREPRKRGTCKEERELLRVT